MNVMPTDLHNKEFVFEAHEAFPKGITWHNTHYIRTFYYKVVDMTSFNCTIIYGKVINNFTSMSLPKEVVFLYHVFMKYYISYNKCTYFALRIHYEAYAKFKVLVD